MNEVSQSRRQLALGTEKVAQNKRRRKITSQQILLQMLEKLGKDNTGLQQIYNALLEGAKKGDKDARDFLGKYLLGNGRLSSEDLHRTPAIRPSRK